MNSKRGQFAIISIVGVIVVLLILAPILLKVVRSITGGFVTGINNTSPEAANIVDGTYGKFVSLWDYVIMSAFAISVILLFISAFFIDTHPAFVLLYIFVAFLVMAFAPSMLDAIDKIWDSPQFATETGVYLQFTEFLKNNFEGIILGIMILSGIIIYAKIRYFSDGY